MAQQKYAICGGGKKIWNKYELRVFYMSQRAKSYSFIFYSL